MTPGIVDGACQGIWRVMYAGEFTRRRSRPSSQVSFPARCDTPDSTSCNSSRSEPKMSSITTSTTWLRLLRRDCGVVGKGRRSITSSGAVVNGWT